MARLEWKEVEAPDFRNSSAGYLAASKLFGEAIESARGGLEDFQKQQGQAADNAVLNGLLKYQGDPKSLEAAMADGSFMNQFDPKVRDRMSAGTRQTLLTRPGDLLAHAVKTSEYNQQQLAITDQGRVRALEPAINEFNALSVQDPSGKLAEEYRLAHPDLKNMSVGDFRNMLTRSQELQRDQHNNTKAVTEFDWDKEDKAVKDKGQALGEELWHANGDSEEVVRQINQNFDALTEKYGYKAVAYARDYAQGKLGGAPAVGGGAGGGGGAGAGPGSNTDPYNTVLGFGAYGNPPKPITTMTLDEVIDFGKNTLIPNSKAAGVGRDERGLMGSSAVGAFQITQSTLQDYAPKVLGANWRSMKFDQATQDKLGEAIFNDTKGGNLKKIWASLPSTAPGAYADKSWDEMKVIIAQNEVGADLRNASTAATTTITGNISGDQDAELARSFLEAAKSTATSRQVAMRLTGKDGSMSGEPTDALVSKINNLMSKYHVNAEVAARVLEQADDGAESLLKPSGWVESINPWADGMNRDFNEKKIDSLMKFVSDPRALADKAIAVDQASQALGGMQQGNAAYDAAVSTYKAKKADAARTGRKFDEAYYGGLVEAARGGQRAGVTAAAMNAVDGQRNPPDPKAAPKAAPAAAPKAAPITGDNPGVRAVNFLERELQAKLNEAPSNAGPTQIKAIQGAFEAKFGITMAEAKKDPDAAARAVRAHNARVTKAKTNATTLLAAESARRTTNFAR